MKASRFSKFALGTKLTRQERSLPASLTCGVQCWYELRKGKVVASIEAGEVTYSSKPSRGYKEALRSLEYWLPSRYSGYLNWMGVLLG